MRSLTERKCPQTHIEQGIIDDLKTGKMNDYALWFMYGFVSSNELAAPVLGVTHNSLYHEMTFALQANVTALQRVDGANYS